jgi:addiction module RelE/StbE family toxin
MRSMPRNVLVKWSLWTEIVLSDGPGALVNYPGFHDESLDGKWAEHRSSRLSGGYRVIYRIQGKELVVEVKRVSHHDYKRRS